MATFLAHVPRKTLLAVKRVAGAQFTCFTRTKVQILTQKALQSVRVRLVRLALPTTVEALAGIYASYLPTNTHTHTHTHTRQQGSRWQVYMPALAHQYTHTHTHSHTHTNTHTHT